MAKKEGRRRRRDESAAEVAGAERQASDTRPWLVSQQAGLKLLVFFAGAVLMGLEIAGSRVLAPHFGNSVFVWGSLISVFLIALAAGYYVGGHLADRRPSRRLLGAVCIAVSVWIFALTAIGHPVCEGISNRGGGEQLGPLVAAAILFLPPSVGLGIVSPFAVRIAATSISSVGQVAGKLYALSTAGSIAGTLVTTFVLIPQLGVLAILRILGFVLLVAAVGTLPPPSGWSARLVLPLLLVIGAFGFLVPGTPAFRLAHGEQILLEADTPYHHISVLDNRLLETRQLRFDQYTESGIRLTPPYRTLQDYTNYFHLAFLLKPKMERVLFIGAGGGTGPRTFFAHDPGLTIDVVDIDPRVLEIATEYFYLPQTHSIRLFAQDGRMFLRQADVTYDCIVLDAFTIGGRIPFHLVTREFLELCRAQMTIDGVFVMNFGSAREGALSAIYHSMLRTASTVFPNVYVFAQDYREARPTQTTNVILVASNESRQLTASEWAARTGQYQSASYVKKPEMEKIVDDMIGEAAVDPAAPIFTDDFAPIETMAF